MTRFMIEMFDIDGKPVAPATWGNSLEFEFPVPVPNNGEEIYLDGDRWRVTKRTFQYFRRDDGSKLKVVLTCSR